jgi:hypothetical protein
MWHRFIFAGLVFIVLVPSTLSFAATEATYVKDVQPILVDRCVSCHGPEKQKGDLRLDSPEAIRKGGKNGPILFAGNPGKSTIYSLTLLPKGDDDIMPAKGDPLTQQQTDAIRDWIAAGAKFDGIVNNGPSVVAPTGPVHLGPSNIDDLASKLSNPDATIIKALTDQGAIIVPISDKKTALDVDLSHLTRPFDDSHVQLLERIAPNIFWLDLHGLAVNDNTVGVVAKCKNIMRLHLEKTQVTSAGLAAIKDSLMLTYLNVLGTKVDDTGLVHLTKLTKLEKLYVMNTSVTSAGSEKLQMALPKLKIVSGLTGVSPPPPSDNDDKKRRKK